MATESHPLVDLIGPVVVDNSGSEFPVAALAGPDTVFGLYFSAHWCPPCRGFTPELAKFYTNMQTTRPGAFEVVFVSSDKSAGQFNEYMGEMPWKALPFDDRARKSTLSSLYGVRGIPTLVLVDAQGKLITDQGRREVSTDPEGADFPWKQKTLIEELSDPSLQLLKSGGAKADKTAVTSRKYIGFYFSAHWCPPCRQFTPMLAAWYNAQREKGADLEVVFVSGDRSEADFNEYLGEMPWTAIPLSNKKLIGRLNEAFQVRGIPALVFVDAEGNVVARDGRAKVMSDPEGFPWPPKPVEDITDALASINDIKTVVLFLDKLTDPAAAVAVSEAFEAVATEYFTSKATKIQFARADEGEATEGLRMQTGLARERDGPKAVSVVVFDIQGAGGKFVFKPDAIPDQAAIKAFVESVLAGTVPKQSLR
jgi:nucleoredoxin